MAGHILRAVSLPAADLDPSARAPRTRGRPPLSAADVAARRDRIVEVAARLFFADGYADTHIDAIGREAGVTKRTIYELVGDKQAVFLAACNKMRAEGPNFRFDVPIAGRSAHEVLVDMATQLIAHTTDPELIALERAILTETRHFPGIVREAVVGGKANLDRAMARIFDGLVRGGQLPPFDTMASASLFYDAVIGARGLRALFGHPAEAVSQVDIAARVDMFIHGFVERQAPGKAVAPHG